MSLGHLWWEKLKAKIKNKKFCKNVSLSYEVMTDTLCELAGKANQNGNQFKRETKGISGKEKRCFYYLGVPGGWLFAKETKGVSYEFPKDNSEFKRY